MFSGIRSGLCNVVGGFPLSADSGLGVSSEITRALCVGLDVTESLGLSLLSEPCFGKSRLGTLTKFSLEAAGLMRPKSFTTSGPARDGGRSAWSSSTLPTELVDFLRSSALLMLSAVLTL